MEPFSAVASAANITDFALSGIKHLHTLITDVKEAGHVVQDIHGGLNGILQSIKALQQMVKSDSDVSSAVQRALDDAGIAKAVNECGEACDEFSKSLTRWTRHSGPDRTSLRDRAAIGIWYKEKINTMRIQVQSCQSRVELAVQIANLLILSRPEKPEGVGGDKKLQVQALERKIETVLDLTEVQQQDLRKRKEELHAGGKNDADAADDEAQRVLALQEVQKQSRLLDEESEALRGQLHAVKTDQQIGRLHTSEDSFAIVGLPESALGEVNQTIGEVITKSRSRAVVGVYKDDFDFSKLHR